MGKILHLQSSRLDKIRLIYKDIFTKFAGNVYGYENLSAKFWPHFEKQNGHHSQLFENHKGVLNLEIF